jgi:hypothetical protein
VVLPSLNAATGGSAQLKRRERRKGSPRRMAPLARRGRAGVGGRRTTRGCATGLLQLRSLASSLFLQSSSAMPSGPHHARRSKLLQPASADANPPTSTSREEGTETETEAEHRCLRIRESSALDHSVTKNTILQARMTLINLAKGCHPCPSVVCDVLYVPVILSLASPLEWRFRRRACVAAAVRPWQSSPWTGLRSLRASPVGEGDHKREVAI